MKKVLVFLMACLASTVMFAQTLPLHYTVVTSGVEAFNTKLYVILKIDGVEQKTTDLEVGAFDQYGVCRGAKRPTYRQATDQYIYMLQLKGNQGDTYYTFKVYDWSTETELDLTYVGETYYYMGNYTYTPVTAPYDLPFESASGYTKDITGYGEGEGNWYLIASPVGAIDVTEVGNLTTGVYDLYSYNQSMPEEEWFNYIQIDGDTTYGFTQLEFGKGYLYANSEDVTLTFPGTAYNGDGTVELVYDEEHAWAGDSYNYYWNLVGNPYADTASIDVSDYYVMNESGTALEIADRENNEVYPIEGVIVMATGEGETVTFTSMGGESAGGGGEFKLNLKVSDGRGHSDLARVRFGQGHDLAKYMLNPSNTKLCFPKEGAEYAVMHAGEMGEMPVSFKAGENGTYTMVFTSSNVSFNYLHLVDNMTGADVDVLANPSYTFEASTTDYASRFKLVFATGSSDGDSFAFYSNGNFIVSNEGEAVLQVVDVMGRILSSETIEGSASINVDAAHGVYMLRLINGNDVKVQKVVVE